MPRYTSGDLARLRDVLAARRAVERSDPARREAAVLIPLFLRSDEVHVVLTKKMDDLRSHSGQVSFPGGGRDPADRDLLATALREADEEAAIAPADVDVLGALDDTPTFSTGYLVRPYVGLVPHPYPLRPDGVEVERILTPPLSVFADEAVRREELWERGGVRYRMGFYDIEGAVVWGLTERLLAVLLALIEGRDPPRLVPPGV